MPIVMARETRSHSPASKLQVSLMRRPPVVKGYIKGLPNGPYYGICLNLNLTVRGRTLQETEQKLFDLILAYLSDAEKSGNWNDLVPRRAPFAYYREYYYLKILSHFRSIAEFKPFVFSAPCSAHA
jgi:hypothetical protein